MIRALLHRIAGWTKTVRAQVPSLSRVGPHRSSPHSGAAAHQWGYTLARNEWGSWTGIVVLHGPGRRRVLSRWCPVSKRLLDAQSVPPEDVRRIEGQVLGEVIASREVWA